MTVVTGLPSRDRPLAPARPGFPQVPIDRSRRRGRLTMACLQPGPGLPTDLDMKRSVLAMVSALTVSAAVLAFALAQQPVAVRIITRPKVPTTENLDRLNLAL